MLFTLFRFYLRRYRVLFVALLALVFFHDLMLLYVFKFWKQQVELADLILSVFPGRVKEAAGIPLTDLTHPLTYKALIMLRPDSRALQLAFGVALGTDVIAGEAGRGTSDLLFSQPVRRRTAVLAGFLTIALHTFCMGLMMVFSFAVLSRILPMGAGAPETHLLVAPVVNIALTSLAVGSTILLVGSLSPTRGRAIFFGVLAIVVPLVLDFMGVFTDQLVWLARPFPEHYHRPHVLLAGSGEITLLQCVAPLLLITLVCTLAAAFFAERRDLSTA
jgi:ABC-type transport system involved in multi-copper enzyme maturation permease subunit